MNALIKHLAKQLANRVVAEVVLDQLDHLYVQLFLSDPYNTDEKKEINEAIRAIIKEHREILLIELAPEVAFIRQHGGEWETAHRAGFSSTKIWTAKKLVRSLS